jgi:hypothetical protein
LLRLSTIMRVAPPMPYVSLIVEFLRARPLAVVWMAVLAQALLWLLLPAALYTSPPGELPQVLAIGHQWQIGSWLGPPLAFWVAELAFNATGGRVIGVYLLSQICVVAAFWAIYLLGCDMVGKRHAAMAALLMTGIFLLSVPTPAFGQHVAALPLTAFALLLYWRALNAPLRRHWIALGFVLGTLLLTTHWGLLLLFLLAAFMPLTPQGRAALKTIDPYGAAALALVIPYPYFFWWLRSGEASNAVAAVSPALSEPASGVLWWPLLLAGFVAAHAGLIVLAVLASRVGVDRAEQAPEIERPLLPSLATPFAAFFVLAPALIGTLIAALFGFSSLSAGGQLALMSALAVIVFAGNPIRIHRQRVVGYAWLALLLAPPVVVILAILIGPWTSFGDFSSQQPADALARFFTDSFHRRVGKRLEIVVGETRPVYLVAAASSDRPSVYSAARPERTPWLTDADVRRRGAIMIWPIEDAVGAPPAAMRALFPELVPEVPQTFPRRMQGLLPTYRVGWAMIRPQPAGETAPAR